MHPPLCRCKAVQSQSLGIVLINAQPLIIALSNKKLHKAAARRLALPSERKPSRFVCSNTAAIDVAAAECTFAVRADQHRASRSKLKCLLLILQDAWSAVKAHARHVRVRGRVLQQRRPLPALGRLADELLPVQPLRCPSWNRPSASFLFDPRK